MNIQKSQIGLIGATGKTGSVLLAELLEQNLNTTILVRNPDRIDINNNHNLSLIIGNATDPKKIKEFVDKVDVIIDVSNARKGEPPITQIVTQHLISNMQKQEKRLFILAGKTIRDENDKFSLKTWFERKMLSFLFPEIIKAKTESLSLLKRSSIKWTFIRCPYIVDGDCKSFNSSLDKCKGKSISKKGIFSFIINEIKEEKYLCKAPFLFN
jgi:putative NADH-flavin reductase